MVDSKADLILHPIRMRILMAVAGKQVTAQQLASALPDVAQATLYRHINRLAKGGVLSVVEERPVRGTVEKVYSLEQHGGWLGPEDVANFSKDDHMRTFTTFVATLLNDFAQYLNSSDKPDPAKDGVTYNKLPIYLSDEELAELSRTINEAAIPLLQNSASPGRKRRVLASILMPATDEVQNEQ